VIFTNTLTLKSVKEQIVKVFKCFGNGLTSELLKMSIIVFSRYFDNHQRQSREIHRQIVTLAPRWGYICSKVSDLVYYAHYSHILF
jgi:hypothetical protein